MIDDLSQKHCIPCEDRNIEPFDSQTAHVYALEIPEWTLDADAKHIFREFKFKNFVKAIEFVNAIADLAESEGHHPDIEISFNVVKLKLWTHAIGGLSENDFILAAKADHVFSIYPKNI